MKPGATESDAWLRCAEYLCMGATPFLPTLVSRLYAEQHINYAQANRMRWRLREVLGRRVMRLHFYIGESVETFITLCCLLAAETDA